MDTKNDAKAEAVMNNPMTDMCPMDPRALFDAIVMHECNEAAMYNMLAQCAPTPCLQRMICLMTPSPQRKRPTRPQPWPPSRLLMPGRHYTDSPRRPAAAKHPPYMPPNFYASGEKKEK
jgi:hypothetical protein